MTVSPQVAQAAASTRSEAEVRLERETKRLERLGRTLGGIRTDRMNGDNLAIILCSFFDNPDQEIDDETNWTPDAISGCDEVLEAIRAHYELKPGLRHD